MFALMSRTHSPSVFPPPFGFPIGEVRTVRIETGKYYKKEGK
jgi:hypothetical protein